MTTYRDKLLDPRWQRKRLEILERDEFCCRSYFDSTNTLHVHHRRYFKGRDPWDYADDELVTLCATCHSDEHDAKEMLNTAICCVDRAFLDWTGIVSLIAGYLVEQAGQLSDEQRIDLEYIGKDWGDADAFEVGRQANLALGAKRTEKLGQPE